MTSEIGVDFGMRGKRSWTSFHSAAAAAIRCGSLDTLTSETPLQGTGDDSAHDVILPSIIQTAIGRTSMSLTGL